MIKLKLQPKTYLFGLLVIALVVGFLLSTRATGIWPFNNTASTTPPDTTNRGITDTASPRNNNPTAKQDIVAPSDGGKTSDQIPVSNSLDASITQLEEAGGQITFSATVQHATSTGTCVVTFSNPNDRPVTKQLAASNNGTTSSCGPVKLSTNEFSYLGSWNVSFHYYEGAQQTEATSQIVIK